MRLLQHCPDSVSANPTLRRFSFRFDARFKIIKQADCFLPPFVFCFLDVDGNNRHNGKTKAKASGEFTQDSSRFVLRRLITIRALIELILLLLSPNPKSNSMISFFQASNCILSRDVSVRARVYNRAGCQFARRNSATIVQSRVAKNTENTRRGRRRTIRVFIAILSPFDLFFSFIQLFPLSICQSFSVC